VHRSELRSDGSSRVALSESSWDGYVWLVTIAEDFFGPWESKSVVSDWTTFVAEINRVLDFTGNAHTLAWRGLSNASYSVHSTLYRRLAAGGKPVNGLIAIQGVGGA
jgi:hypothetical protein